MHQISIPIPREHGAHNQAVIWSMENWDVPLADVLRGEIPDLCLRGCFEMSVSTAPLIDSNQPHHANITLS